VSRQFDAIIIGTGQAGPSLAAGFADAGMSVAIIERHKFGGTCDDQLQTNVPGIWALGDCNGRGAFTHTSYNDYEIVADNLLNAGHRRVSDRIQTYALFTDPPLGRCGMTDAEIRNSGRAALATKHPMSRVSRAVEKGETQGFIKISGSDELASLCNTSMTGMSRM